MDEELLKKYFRKDKLAEHLGIELEEISEGYARGHLKIGDIHLNSIDTVHGATIFALADLVFAAASNSHGNVSVGINVSISYVKAVSRGVLTAEAIEQSINPKLATYEVKVRDDAGDTVAIFQGMVYRKKDAIKNG